jgi:serine/threonine-protein kinase
MLTADRWRRIAELFDRIVDLDPAEQRVLLARSDVDDLSIRVEVERMLAAHASTGVLDEPVAPRLAAALSTATSGLAPGSWAGPYQVRREIDRGGMGIVYEAHDPRLDRPVALKWLPPGAASTLAKNADGPKGRPGSPLAKARRVTTTA